MEPGEIRGTVERANYMLSIAAGALADVYPYLTMINSVLPAIIAGNVVILKLYPQTPLTAERLQQAFAAALLPANVLQVVHLSLESVNTIIKHPCVDFISFTGSVNNGMNVAKASVQGNGFPGVALEVGLLNSALAWSMNNNDLPYVELHRVYFNSGQSCCAVEVWIPLHFLACVE
ncbi:hypothetical protein BS47DRAFT_1356258 [Hydnum rufescens UP504]|uniref:Aldehyde dehydrogenase domain-containing protein n=1 Tax=Hydnum rufescens UP504 TaxID=1448309 RepID=A0A9P6DMB9_9AGAM|nr:hypothetical protein BS47DRAFT_1356258 [Hydnum rufescens UP504]